MAEERSATGEWNYISREQLPDVATVSGETPSYLCSGDLLIQSKDGSYYAGWVDIYQNEKVWRFYDSSTGQEIKDRVVRWAQITGEEAF